MSKELSILIRELASVVGMLYTAYSCIIGAFFAVFVPQSCPQTFGSGVNATVLHSTCTFAQNTTEDIDYFNQIVLIVNLVSALLLLGGFAFEFARERFIIITFDIDVQKPDSHLQLQLITFPKVREALHWYNSVYRGLFAFILIFNIANVGLSIRLIYIFYDGYRSVITFITNFLILFSRLCNSIWLAHTCDTEGKAQLANQYENLNFNVLSAAIEAGANTNFPASQRFGTCVAAPPPTRPAPQPPPLSFALLNHANHTRTPPHAPTHNQPFPACPLITRPGEMPPLLLVVRRCRLGHSSCVFPALLCSTTPRFVYYFADCSLVLSLFLLELAPAKIVRVLHGHLLAVCSLGQGERAPVLRGRCLCLLALA